MHLNRFREDDGGDQCTFAFPDSSVGCVLVACIRNKYEEGGCVEKKVRDCASDGGGTVDTESGNGNIGIGRDDGAEEVEVSWQRMWLPYGKELGHRLSGKVWIVMAALKCGKKNWTWKVVSVGNQNEMPRSRVVGRMRMTTWLEGLVHKVSYTILRIRRLRETVQEGDDRCGYEVPGLSDEL